MHRDAFEPQVQDFFSLSASSQCSPISEHTLLVNYEQNEHIFNWFSHSSRVKYIFSVICKYLSSSHSMKNHSLTRKLKLLFFLKLAVFPFFRSGQEKI